jgi:hypothetical protein
MTARQVLKNLQRVSKMFLAGAIQLSVRESERVEQAFRDCMEPPRKEDRGDERVEQAFRPAARLQGEPALAAEVVLKISDSHHSQRRYLRG